MPIFGQINFNYVTTTLYYGPKKLIGCPLFSIYMKKSLLSCPYFAKKNAHSLKNTLLSRPYFSKIGTTTISKTQSHVIFSKFSVKIPMLSYPYLFKKTYILSKLHYIVGFKKSIRMPFFSDFSRKNGCSHAQILSTKRPFSKKDTAPMPIFCQKNVHSLENTMFSCHFFKFSRKSPCWHSHIWSKKRQFCQNYNTLWAKKVERMPLCFLFFTKNINCHAYISSKKCPFQQQ